MIDIGPNLADTLQVFSVMAALAAASWVIWGNY